MIFTTISNAKKQTGVSYLGGINLSAKMIKNKKVNHYTYSLNLSPAKTSGYNVCPNSTNECHLGCLATSGHAKLELIANKKTIQNARILKTKLFFEENEFFMQWLIAELNLYQNKANKDGYHFSARLNTISDIDWKDVYYNGKNIFEMFPCVQFYDYTKNYKKFINQPLNYHLTYSYTGKNKKECLDLLKIGKNIAVIFNVKNEKNLPKTFLGYNVINGDENDYRPNDNSGVIVGLKFKRIADREAESKVIKSCFVVQPNDINVMV